MFVKIDLYRKIFSITVLVFSTLLVHPQSPRSSQDYTIFGDTLFQGKWSARGAMNQAGPVALAVYDKDDKSYTIVTTSGYLYSRKESSGEWTLLNQNNKFNHVVGLSRYTVGGNSHITVASINGFVNYTADGGKTWSPSTGIESLAGFSTVQKMTQGNNGDVLILLEEKIGQAETALYESNDFGQSFRKIKTFSSPIPLSLDNYDISGLLGDDSSIAVVYVDTLSFYNVYSDSLRFHSRIPAFSFGQARFSGCVKNGVSYFYLNRGGAIYKFDSTNSSWNRKSTIQHTSRTPYTFSISTDQPNRVFVGDNDFYKSLDSGQTWSVHNTLGDYIANRITNLHPGINSISSFFNSGGIEVLLIATDGGVFISQNQMNGTNNLSLTGLPIGNYYDINIVSENESKLFASSEVQGLQSFKSFNTDSTINTNNANWETTYSSVLGNGNNNLWAITASRVGYISNLSDNFFRTSWKYSDSLEIGLNRPIIERFPSSVSEVYVTGLFRKNDPDKKCFIYKVLYNGTSISVERLDRNFNLNIGKTEFVTDLEISKSNSANWYLITNEGNFYASQDTGKTWKRSAFFTGLFANERFGSTILASEHQEGLVYAGGKGNGNGSIYFSQNFGKDFRLLGTGLKETEVFGLSMINEDSLLFASTKDGPYVFSKEFQKWQFLGTEDTPLKDWTCVQAYEGENSVWFGTFGQGLWELDYQYFKDSLISVQENVAQQSKIKIYPNPSNQSSLKIKGSSPFSKILFFTNEGKLVKQFSLNVSEEIELDTQELKSGSYQIQVLHEDGSQSIKRWIKL